MKPKMLFLLSLIPTCWIVILAATYYMKFDPVWLGVLRELVTIPVLMGAIFLLFLNLKAWKKELYVVRSYSFYAILLIVISLSLLFIN